MSFSSLAAHNGLRSALLEPVISRRSCFSGPVADRIRARCQSRPEPRHATIRTPRGQARCAIKKAPGSAPGSKWLDPETSPDDFEAQSDGCAGEPDVVYAQDTIVAPATPPGKGAVAIVRLSGADATRIAAALWHHVGAAAPRPRHLTLGELRDPSTGAIIDRAMCVTMLAPASLTGEDVVEFHCHGGP